MQKLKKLVLTTGIFSSSLFFNQGYAQETKEYYIGNPNDPKSEIKRISEKTWVELNNQNNYSYWRKDAVDKNGVTKWYIAPRTNPQATPPQNTTKTSPQNKVTNYSNVNKNTYIPPKSSSNNSDLDKALLIGGVTIGTLWLINELSKPRNRTPVYNSSPANNNPTTTNYNFGNNINWWEEKTPKTEDKNWWEEKEDKNKSLGENKQEFKSVKSIEEVLKEQQQKKADAEKRGIENSKKLSDFVEKQAGASPETKAWFDEEARKADEFYKEYYKNDPKAYAEIPKADKLSKIIGYNAYKLGEKTSAGPVLEGMEIYEDIKEEGIENLWKEEVKEADEFFKEHEYQKPKVMPDEKGLEKILNTDVHTPKVEYEQTNKIIYESDVAKVIRYRTYQYIKSNTEAGDVIKGLEKVDEIKNWWDK